MRPFKLWDITQHNGWGNNIQWTPYDKSRLVGWTSPHPQIGDRLVCNMHSGKKGVFEFIKIEPCCDPPDMWFATVKDVGYVDEINGYYCRVICTCI